MALSFGFDTKIVNSPLYNLGYSLPFFCAFYLLNAESSFSLPFGFSVNGEVASLLHLISAAFYYLMFIIFVALGSHLSGLIEDSKSWLIYVVLILLFSVYSAIVNEGQSKITLYFALLATIILITVFFKRHNSNISWIVTSLLGAIASLACFTSGVMWYFETYLFKKAVMAAFGLQTINPNSLKVGAVMLFTMGYVIYYGVFKLSEIYTPSPTGQINVD